MELNLSISLFCLGEARKRHLLATQLAEIYRGRNLISIVDVFISSSTNHTVLTEYETMHRIGLPFIFKQCAMFVLELMFCSVEWEYL